MKYLKLKKEKKNFKNNLYDVEYIITRKTIGKKYFYLIKWKDYPITQCSWEPISHLHNVIDMVNEFNDNFPYSIKQESLKVFNNEFNHYKIHKKKNKKKKKDNKICKETKIVIPIEDISSDDSTNNEGNKEIEKINIDSNIIFENKDVKNNDDKFNEIILNHDISDINNTGKLIWPIIIW